MASTNGFLAPSPRPHVAEPRPILPPVKRKRSITELDRINIISDARVVSEESRVLESTQDELVEFLEVIQSYDVTKSVSNRRLPSRRLTDEPSAKRAKVEIGSETYTISSRVAAKQYATLDEVISDVKLACTSIMDDLKPQEETAKTQYTPLSPEVAEYTSQLLVFRRKVEDLAHQEKARKLSRLVRSAADMPETPNSYTNGLSQAKSVTQLIATPGDSKLVLTLYANAPNAKQLFSSLQEPVVGEGRVCASSRLLREAGLPTGINTTQIVPLQSNGLGEDRKAVPTLGDLFASSDFSLPLPKSAKSAVTRNSSVGWYRPTVLTGNRAKNSEDYFGQNITAGQWLDYNGAVVDAKKKQKERALSLNGPRNLNADTPDSVETLDSLFNNAYSSFAPSKDESAAIVSEGQLNRIWWQKVGEKSFERLVSLTKDAVVTSESSVALSMDGKRDDIPDEFSESVDEWDHEVLDPLLKDNPTKPIKEKEVDEILHDISELLETLHSYQRNRLSALKTTISGSVSKPDDVEHATYNSLQAQLSLMIAMLPPYAVSKLNSNQLAELNISTKVQILTSEYRGVMEEDEEAQRAKVAEMANKSRSTAPPSTHRSSAALYGNQYSSSTKASVPAASRYYETQTPVRPPPATTSRPPATAPAPYAARPPSSTSYRSQSGYGVPTYPHQLPRSTQPSYSSTTSQYYQGATAPSYGYSQNFGAGSHNGSQSAATNRYQASNSTYTPRPTASTMEYRYSNGTTRPTSPSKLAYSPQPTTANPNRTYATPTPSISQRYYQAPASQGTASSQPASVPSPGVLGATGYHTVMTAAEQSTMMERQRAQIAQQQGTQQPPRPNAQSTTPNGVTAT